jgi:hypothetical protein
MLGGPPDLNQGQELISSYLVVLSDNISDFGMYCTSIGDRAGRQRGEGSGVQDFEGEATGNQSFPIGS